MTEDPRIEVIRDLMGKCDHIYHKQYSEACDALDSLESDKAKLVEALANVKVELMGCLERDTKAFMAMTIEQVGAWNIARHNQSHGYCLDQIKDAIESIKGP